MAEKVTLKKFGAEGRHYHVYRIRNSALDHIDHYHDYYQVCYVVSGEIIHRKEKETVILQSGDAFIVPPGFVHSLTFKNVYSELYSLSFLPCLFSQDFPQSNAHHFLTSLQEGEQDNTAGAIRLRLAMDQSQRQSVEALMQCLIRQQETDCPIELSAAPSLVTAILNILSQSYYRKQENYQALQALMLYSNTMRNCVQYVDQHYKENISLDQLVKLFGISRSVFYSTFPHFTGMSLRKYIAHKRIEEAQILIRTHPNMSVSQVAVEVGYDDDSTFYRNFKKITGISPTDYRAEEMSHSR